MAIAKSQIGHQLPVDRPDGPQAGRSQGLDVGEKLRTVSLLLAVGRQGFGGGELHMHARRLILSDRDVMASRPRRSRELVKDPMSPIPWLCASRRCGQPIGLHSHQKARADILRQAKEFVLSLSRSATCTQRSGGPTACQTPSGTAPFAS